MVTNSTPGPPALIDELVERRAVLDQALEYVGGPELDRLLVDVVGQSKPLPEFERRHGYPTGSGQLGLRIALVQGGAGGMVGAADGSDEPSWVMATEGRAAAEAWPELEAWNSEPPERVWEIRLPAQRLPILIGRDR